MSTARRSSDWSSLMDPDYWLPAQGAGGAQVVSSPVLNQSGTPGLDQARGGDSTPLRASFLSASADDLEGSGND